MQYFFKYFFLKKTKWGFFYECNIQNLRNINYVTNRSLQTFTYFGFSKKDDLSYFLQFHHL